MDGPGQVMSSEVGGLNCRICPFVFFFLSSEADQQPSHLFSVGIDDLNDDVGP